MVQTWRARWGPGGLGQVGGQGPDVGQRAGARWGPGGADQIAGEKVPFHHTTYIGNNKTQKTRNK